MNLTNDGSESAEIVTETAYSRHIGDINRAIHAFENHSLHIGTSPQDFRQRGEDFFRHKTIVGIPANSLTTALRMFACVNCPIRELPDTCSSRTRWGITKGTFYFI
ncbi:MAG: hypothetical protein R3C20_09820 [Planctomycetaceae bacterium]